MTVPDFIWPRPDRVAPIKADGEWDGDDWLVCSLGNSGADGRDWVIATDCVRASELADSDFPSDAKEDAMFLVNLVQAYASGDLVRRDPAVLAALPEVARLREALEDIAKQKLTTEIATDYEADYADFETGYDECIKRARYALEGSQA